MSNRLDLNQSRRFVGPDLGSKCLRKLLADETRKNVEILPGVLGEYEKQGIILEEQRPNLSRNIIGGQGTLNQFSILGEQGNKPIYPMGDGEIVTYPLSC